MKNFLLITLIFAFFTGCSSSNAFSRFNLTPEQAKSENSILSSKIHSSNKIVGVVSAVYLNQVLPKTYNKNESFYVSFYTKNAVKDLKFFLNAKEAIKIKELESDNEFSSILASKEDWKKYYFVEFSKQGEKLSFVAQTKRYKSDALVYKKED